MLALVCGLGIFNIRLVSKASAAMSEEDWLASEIRKGEMRRRLVGLADQDNIVSPDVMAKAKSESSTATLSWAAAPSRVLSQARCLPCVLVLF